MTRRFLRDRFFLPGLFCLILALAACDSSSTPRSSAVLPPGSDQRPVEAGQTGRALGPDGLPPLDPPKGVNVSVDSLFGEDIKDPITRIKRLENAVQEMRRDYEATLPAIKRLVGIEKDMQTLMKQLEILTNGDMPPVASVPLDAVTTESAMPAAATAALSQNDPAHPVPAVPDARSPAVSPQETNPVAIPALTAEDAVAPAEPASPTPVRTAEATPAKAQAPPPAQPPPATAPPPAVIPKPAVFTPVAPPASPPAKTPDAAPIGAASSGVAASSVRLGEAAGKTRLVIDLNRSVSHTTDLDNDEKILVIEISDAAWNTAATKTFTSPIVQSYATQPLENRKGTRLIVTLKKTVAIVVDSVLPPEANNKNYRLVIDLKEK